MALFVPAPPTAAPPRRRLRPVLVGLGVLAVVAGLVLWIVAGRRYDDAVTDLAPAPVGCDTSLEFDDPGTYTFFVETRGRIGAIDGDCASEGRDYDFGGDVLPRVSLSLSNPAGEEIDLDRVDGPSYDRAGRAGTAVRRARVPAAGTYVLTVDANDPDVVVRVGRDPKQGVTPLRVGATVLVVGGLVGIALGLILGRRRSSPASPSGPPPHWQPTGGPPPVAPPYAHHPTSPPFGPGRPPGTVWGSPRPPESPPARPAPPPGPASPGRPLPPPPPPPPR